MCWRSDQRTRQAPHCLNFCAVFFSLWFLGFFRFFGIFFSLWAALHDIYVQGRDHHHLLLHSISHVVGTGTRNHSTPPTQSITPPLHLSPLTSSPLRPSHHLHYTHRLNRPDRGIDHHRIDERQEIYIHYRQPSRSRGIFGIWDLGLASLHKPLSIIPLSFFFFDT